MSYQERLKLFSEIEKIRGRPLITYMTSRRDFMGGLLGMDSIPPEFCEHIRHIPDNEDKNDLLIASRGAIRMLHGELSISCVADSKMINPLKIESTSEDSIVAIVESKYAKSYYLSKTVISATRANDLSIACNVLPINIGWKTEVQSNGNE